MAKKNCGLSFYLTMIMAKCMTLLIICTAKAYQELHIITIFKFFSIVNIMSDRVKICQFSGSPFALKDFFFKFPTFKDYQTFCNV